MKTEERSLKKQGSSAPIILPAPVDSLYTPDDSFWPQTVRTSGKLRLLASRRLGLLENLERLFLSVPDVRMDFGQALENGLVDTDCLSTVYETLTKILDEQYGERLLLYLPLELIPGSTWSTSNRALALQITRFKESYLHAWRRLLVQHDHRANFVDGDIPEAEICTRPLPKVVKAMHLAPSLVRKGILAASEVTLLHRSLDPLLRASVEEILPFLTAGAFEPEPNKTQTVIANDWNVHYFEHRVRSIEATISELQQSPLQPGIPRARAIWLAKQGEKEFADASASDIALALVEKSLASSEVARVVTQTQDPILREIMLLAARKSLEVIARTDRLQAQNMYLELESTLHGLYQKGDIALQDTLKGIWSRLIVQDIADETSLRALGITVPILDGRAAAHSERLNDRLTVLAQAIANDAVLSVLLLPVVIVYGSQIKGYGGSSSDVDVAVFVRAGIDLRERNRIQEALGNILQALGMDGKPVEFWLQENAATIGIRDFKNPDRSLGDSTLVHTLFGGVWVGDRLAIKHLYKSVLAEYLFPSRDIQLLGRPAREIWLREMERDALQYRLMHKGYHRFFPEYTSAWLPYGIPDTTGAFWDPGYRRIATKLFIRKVFLPGL